LESEERHAESCASRAEKRCNCAPRFRGHLKDSAGRKIRSRGFVEHMRATGAAPSTVHNRLDPLRVIVRRAIDNDKLLVTHAPG
jgi:hypothetical protein